MRSWLWSIKAVHVLCHLIAPSSRLCEILLEHVLADIEMPLIGLYNLFNKWPPFRRRHFQMHFLNENVWISIKILLKFVPEGPINNIPALFQTMTWCWSGDKSLSESMVFNLMMYICITCPHWVKLKIVCIQAQTWYDYSLPKMFSIHFDSSFIVF